MVQTGKNKSNVELPYQVLVILVSVVKQIMSDS